MNLGIFADRPHQVIDIVYPEQVRHLDIVIKTRPVQGGVEFEPVGCHFTRKPDAAAADHRTILDPGGT